MATIGTCPLIQKTHTKTILHAGFLRKALPGSHLNRLRAPLLTRGALALPRAASSPHPNLARLEKGPADSRWGLKTSSYGGLNYLPFWSVL